MVRPATSPQAKAPAPSWDHGPAKCADAGDAADQRRACDGRHEERSRQPEKERPVPHENAMSGMCYRADLAWDKRFAGDRVEQKTRAARAEKGEWREAPCATNLPPAKPRPSMRGPNEDELAGLLAPDERE